MQIDNNPMEIEAMALFKQGKGREASKLQDEFLKAVKDSGVDHCTCPGNCKVHGDCVQCLILHRGHGDHVPHCMRVMINRKVASLAALAEHSYKRE